MLQEWRKPNTCEDAKIKSDLCVSLLLWFSALALEGCRAGTSHFSKQQWIDNGEHLLDIPFSPTQLHRDHSCPVSALSAEATVAQEPVRYLSVLDSRAAARWNALTPLLTSLNLHHLVKITVVQLHRVNGVPQAFYFSNGTQDDRFQPWSASKYIAFAGMGSTLRWSSGGKVGLNSETTDALDGQTVHVGDLISIATSYRQLRGYNSNSLGSWAQNLTGRANANALIQQWLGRKSENFSGAYGTESSQLGSTFLNHQGGTVSLTPQSTGGNVISLSSYTMAEFLKRLVLHRELHDADLARGQTDPAFKTRMQTQFLPDTRSVPHLQWEDVQTLLYGAPVQGSKYFASQYLNGYAGGMQGGMSSYLHEALGGWRSEQLDQNTRGLWRTFTKIGGGPGSAPGANLDYVWTGYACVPSFDSNNQALENGKEFIVALSVAGTPGRLNPDSDDVVLKVVGAVTQEILSGRLDGSMPWRPSQASGGLNVPLDDWQAQKCAQLNPAQARGFAAAACAENWSCRLACLEASRQ